MFFCKMKKISCHTKWGGGYYETILVKKSVTCKALRKTAFAEISVFASFGNRVLPKFESRRVFRAFAETREIFAKKFGKKFGNFRPKMVIFGHFWQQKLQKKLKTRLKFRVFRVFITGDSPVI